MWHSDGRPGCPRPIPCMECLRISPTLGCHPSRLGRATPAGAAFGMLWTWITPSSWLTTALLLVILPTTPPLGSVLRSLGCCYQWLSSAIYSDTWSPRDQVSLCPHTGWHSAGDQMRNGSGSAVTHNYDLAAPSWRSFRRGPPAQSHLHIIDNKLYGCPKAPNPNHHIEPHLCPFGATLPGTSHVPLCGGPARPGRVGLASAQWQETVYDEDEDYALTEEAPEDEDVFPWNWPEACHDVRISVSLKHKGCFTDLPRVKDVIAQAMTTQEVVVFWPSLNDPQVTNYKIEYRPVGTDSPYWTTSVTDANCKFYRSDTERMCSANILDLTPHNSYVFRVVSKGNKAHSSSKPSEEFILENLMPKFVVKNLQDRGVSPNSITLEWEYTGPSPASFRIRNFGMKRYWGEMGEDKVITTHDRRPKTTERNKFPYTGLWPNGNYTFSVSVLYANREYWHVNLTEKTKNTEPPVHGLKAPMFVQHLNSAEVYLRLFMASEENGKIREYWLVIVPVEWLDTMGYKDNFQTERNSIKPDEIAALDLGNKALEQTLSSNFPKNVSKPWVAARFSRTQLRDVVITERYLVGGLRKKHKYRAFMRAFVETSSADGDIFKSSNFSPSFEAWRGDKSLGPGTGTADAGDLWILGPIVAALICILIACALFVLFLRRKKNRSLPTKNGQISKVAMMSQGNHDPMESSKLLIHDGYGTGGGVPTTGFIQPQIDPHQHHQHELIMPVVSHDAATLELKHRGGGYPVVPPGGGPPGLAHPPIPITELNNHINRLKSNDMYLFSQEYESIETGQHFTWEHSNNDANKPKNRYANVIAYDHSRVQLGVLDGIPGSDYINANFCDGYRKPKAYIATQGPLHETFGDFWRMVWEESCATIVMLTKLEERTRVKCDQYWPTRGSHSYGVISVTLKENIALAHYTIRTFLVQRVGYPDTREVRQLQFTAWPDHGVPDHPTPFLIFLKRVKALNPPDAGPITVHCSAGVGRTGAFIVIDCMLDRLRYENTVDIHGTVTCLRAQRNYMVQTEDQYVFIHDAVLDAVQSGSTEVPISKLYTHLQKLIQTSPMDGLSGMEMEFRHLTTLRLPNASATAANLPCNKVKNRLVNILPYDSTRVYLMPVGALEGSDYINANFVDGYRASGAYMATQGPLPNTAEDFWRMLWEHNSTIVVMLTRLREMGRDKCFQYWPSERAQQYGHLVVDPIAEYNMPIYVLREFKLTDTTDGQTRTVRHFNYIEWPEQGVPKSAENFIDFIGQIHKTKEQFGQDGPITVHCSAGVGRTGVFIALSIILDRMRYENVVDVFTTVKLLRTQRPNMIQSEDQYHFCYQAALEYLNSFDHYAMQ